MKTFYRIGVWDAPPYGRTGGGVNAPPAKAQADKMFINRARSTCPRAARPCRSILKRAIGRVAVIAATITTTAVATASCSAIRSARDTLHGDGDSNKEEAVSQDPQPGYAGLFVTVEPKEGISILVDGRKVATEAPYFHGQLRDGPHTLLVRGMGYHTVTLPLGLAAGHTLDVPVQLRKREAQEAQPYVREKIGEGLTSQQRKAKAEAANAKRKKAAAAARAKAKAEAGKRGRRSAGGPALPTPSREELDIGQAPITVQMLASPPATLYLEEQVLHGNQAELAYQDGTLRAGSIRLYYQRREAGRLRITVAKDGAVWTSNGEPLDAGASFGLLPGVTRLRRVDKNGSEQTVLLRRRR